MWLVLLGGSCLLIALVLALAGAWLILPFAGLEVVLLLWAFREIGKGDQDFESVSAGDGAWRLEARRGSEVQSVGGALAWLGIEQTRQRGNLELRLRYAGRSYLVGAFLGEAQRVALGRDLRKLIESAR